MDEVLDERHYLVKAQEAEAFANGASSQALRLQWDVIAKEYRNLAREIAKLTREDAKNKTP